MADPTPEERRESMRAEIGRMLEKDADCGDYIDCFGVVAERHVREAEAAARAKAFEEASEIAGRVAGRGCYDYQTARNIQESIRRKAKEAPRG